MRHDGRGGPGGRATREVDGPAPGPHIGDDEGGHKRGVVTGFPVPSRHSVAASRHALC